MGKTHAGATTRKYGNAVRQFTEAYGLEKSAVSERYIEASRAKLKALMERPLEKMKFCALLVDATPFQGQQMVAALGVCQVHKRRKVLDHLREEDKLLVAMKLNAAYALPDYDAAKKALDGLHRELMDLNPSAARSLGEGLEDADRAQTSCSRATAENAGQYQPD